MAEAIANAGPLLAHLQVEDSHRLAPDGRHIDFPPIVEALRRIHYNGFLSFEFFWIAPELLLPADIRSLRCRSVRGLQSMRALVHTASNGPHELDCGAERRNQTSSRQHAIEQRLVILGQFRPSLVAPAAMALEAD